MYCHAAILLKEVALANINESDLLQMHNKGIRRPLSLDKAVRRVVIADPSCFLPYRAQNPPVCAAPQLSK